MVHALKEAHRILRPDGLLVDVRPAPVHTRACVVHAGRSQLSSTIRQNLERDRAAERAIAAVLRMGIFKLVRTSRFGCKLVCDSADDAREWISEPVRHERLLSKLEDARIAHGRGAKIVLRAPVVVRTLIRVDPSG